VDGLTSTLVTAVLEGAAGEGAVSELVHLNRIDVRVCEAHNLDGRGWGTCRDEGTCLLTDAFQQVRTQVNAADALVFGTPVYFGDISESAKRFLDRWRRCERTRVKSPLIGKPAIGIAAAGGSGGTTSKSTSGACSSPCSTWCRSPSDRRRTRRPCYEWPANGWPACIGRI
jgi:multimeric flavodoxin WrbA